MNRRFFCYYSASYDADGNMTARNGYAIAWTPSNLPESIASAQGSSTFSYDPEHARYYQSATFNSVTTNTTYIGGLFEAISISTGNTEYRHNIVAGGQVIAVHTIDANGGASTDYLHYDHLGSVDAITDDQGNVIQAMSFDAFGLRRDATNWDYDLSQNTIATLKNYTNRGYTDQEELDNVSLVHMNGRVYDPTVGRFISADPAMQFPYFSQNFDRYSYVFNDPLSLIDPSGYDACLSNLGPAAGAGVWSGIGYATGYITGSYVGGVVGGAIGGVGNVFGPEVGVPSTLVGVAAGRFYGPAIFGAIGGFIGDFAHYEFCEKMPKEIPPKVSPKTQPPNSPKTASPPPPPPPPAKGAGGGGGGGNPNRTGSYSYIPVCKTIIYDYYSGPPGSPGTYYQFTTSTTVCF